MLLRQFQKAQRSRTTSRAVKQSSSDCQQVSTSLTKLTDPRKIAWLERRTKKSKKTNPRSNPQRRPPIDRKKIKIVLLFEQYNRGRIYSITTKDLRNMLIRNIPKHDLGYSPFKRLFNAASRCVGQVKCRCKSNRSRIANS